MGMQEIKLNNSEGQETLSLAEEQEITFPLYNIEVKNRYLHQSYCYA